MIFSNFWLVIAKQKTTVHPADNVLLQSFEKIYLGFQALKISSDPESAGCPSVLRGFFTRHAHCCGFFNGPLAVR